MAIHFNGGDTMRYLNTLALAGAAIAALTSASSAQAGAVVAGFDANTQVRSDDRSDPTGLFFAPLNFFGQNYASGYVGSNGYITFGTAQSGFQPQGLGAAYRGAPIIAAFYTDIDTRNPLTGQATYGNGTFEGRDAFGATWNRVGRYNFQADAFNTFQILLVDRGDIGVGDFDIVLNYDSIEWDQTTNRVGSPSVGYSNGSGVDGTYYQLPGSLEASQFRNGDPRALATNSNTGVAGRYRFSVRNGEVAPVDPVGAVPEPATWAMLILGFAMVGHAVRRRPTVRFAVA